MSRYIDAEYCEDFFDSWESRVKNADPVTIDVVQNTRTLLHDAPSIDIVRCKECRWWLKNLTEDDEDEAYLHCPIEDSKPDGFCSYGERKEQTVPQTDCSWK